ncbi:hypothetical protein [Paenibacillus sanguinis]|uniref:hypothetical protein n=1 Tax=Paenibacillus sanguinis TaxID=225906 RepID=UPI0003782CD4|nr:hypothetical protein [Paenibacillus sanguinis]
MKFIYNILYIIILTSCGTVQAFMANSTLPGPDQFKYELGVKKMNYSSRGTNVFYPQFTTVHDLEFMKKMNEIVKEDITKLYNEIDPNLHLEMDYVITQFMDSIISIQYSGLMYGEEMPYPTNLFYTTNINTDTGEKVNLQDIVKIDQKFVSLLKNGHYIYVSDESNEEIEAYVRELFTSYSDEELISYLNQADRAYDSNPLGIFSYYSQTVGLSLQVPHALGDYVEIEIKLSDLEVRKKMP